jgi:hypothetical protein
MFSRVVNLEKRVHVREMGPKSRRSYVPAFGSPSQPMLDRDQSKAPGVLRPQNWRAKEQGIA